MVGRDTETPAEVTVPTALVVRGSTVSTDRS
jgi:hypothetical protein